MEEVIKAINKALLLKGPNFLNNTCSLNNILDDLIPESRFKRDAIQLIYNDEIGQILYEVVKAPYNDREKYYQALDMYLQDTIGLQEQKRNDFIGIFRQAFRRKSIEVKKYKDYKPALRALKNEFGPVVSDEVLQRFIEDNKLFYRFSLTIDDVIVDLKNVQ